MKAESLRQFCITLRTVLNGKQLFEAIIQLHASEKGVDRGKDSYLVLGREQKELLTNWDVAFRYQ